jgi:hypothetical protein
MRAKGTFSLVALVLVIVGFAIVFATNGNIRVRWWSWRMHSSDAAVAARARLELFRIGRPTIDELMPELVAQELLARREGPWATVGIVRRDKKATFHFEQPLFYCLEVVPRDATAELLLSRACSRALAFHYDGNIFGNSCIPTSIAVPLDDDLAPQILECVRAEIEVR